MKRQVVVWLMCVSLLAAILSSLAVIFAVLVVFTLPEVFMRVMTRYYESNATAMAGYLSNRYSLVFPEGISNVRAAKAANDASGNYSFIMKFQVHTEDVDSFLGNFGKSLAELQPYDPSYDYRLIGNTPEWFNCPIASGRLGSFGLHATDVAHVSFPFKVYIDLSNDSFVLIYMSGNYKRSGG